MTGDVVLRPGACDCVSIIPEPEAPPSQLLCLLNSVSIKEIQTCMHIAQTWFFQGRAKIAEPLGRGILVLLIQFHLGKEKSQRK